MNNSIFSEQLSSGSPVVSREHAYSDLDLYQKDRVAFVLMNRFKDDKRVARQAANHLDDVLIKQLIAVMQELDKDQSVDSIILSSAHRMAFSRGAKIEVILNTSFEEGLKIVEEAQEIILVMARITKPIIAAINGITLGGGLELAMACDYRVSSNRATVMFGLPEASLGILPGMGGTQNLTRLVGKEKALGYMVRAGAEINPDTAKKEGLVDLVVDYDQLLDEAFTFAQKGNLKKTFNTQNFGKVSVDRAQIRLDLQKWIEEHKMEVLEDEKAAPLSKTLIHFVIENTSQDKLLDALIYEQEAFSYLVTTQDAQEGVTALVEKREPEFVAK